jgi:hypothetical protein
MLSTELLFPGRTACCVPCCGRAIEVPLQYIRPYLQPSPAPRGLSITSNGPHKTVTIQDVKADETRS